MTPARDAHRLAVGWLSCTIVLAIGCSDPSAGSQEPAPPSVDARTTERDDAPATRLIRSASEATGPRRALPVRWISTSSTRGGAAPSPLEPAFVVQSGHTLAVRDLAISPDGALLASAGNDSIVKLWDLAMGREIRTLTGAVGPLYSVAFHPTAGRVAAAGVDRRIYLWDIDDGRIVRTLEGHQGWIHSIAFSATGDRMVSASRDKLAVIWTVADGGIGQVLNHEHNVMAAAFSPDGRFVVTRSSGGMYLWNAENGAQLHHWQLGSDRNDRMLFDPQSRWIAAAAGKQTQVLGLDDFAVRQTFDGVPIGLRTSDGALAILDRIGHVRFVNPVSGEIASEVETVDAPSVESVDEARAKQGPLSLDFLRFNAPDENALLSPDGQTLVAASIGATIGLWDARTGAAVGMLGNRMDLPYGQTMGNMMRPFAMAWHPGAPVFATTGLDTMVRVVDLSAAAAPRVVGKHEAPVWAIAWHPTSRVLATAGSDGPIRLWDTVLNRSLGKLELPDGVRMIETLAFSPDGALLASGHYGDQDGDGKIVLWDFARGGVKQVLTDLGPARNHKFYFSAVGSPVSSLAFSPDGKQLASTCRAASRLSIWDTNSGEQRRSGVAVPEFANSVAFSADSTLVAVASGFPKEFEDPARGVFENIITLFDAATGQKTISLSGHQNSVTAIAFSPTANLLASGSVDATVRLWDTSTGKAIAVLRGHTAEVESIAFSSDGRFLASGGRDMTTRIWNVAERTPMAVLVSFGSDNFVWATTENYYTASRQGLKAVAFRLGRHAVPFEQFDLRLNRPDLVLERFGYAPSAVLDSYRGVYQHRLKRMGLEASPEKATYELPRIELVERPARSTEKRRLTVRLRTSESSGYLARLQVYVNDVPIWGAAGADLGEQRAASGEVEADIDLAPGANKVQLSVMNERGVESLPETAEVYYHAPAERPRLFAVAIGVSKYRDPRLELEYAAKDARDIVELFQGFGDRYSAIEPLLLTDAQVTRERVLKAREFLEQTRVDDVAVVFVAGHGFLHAGRDYYFGTFDVDPRAPDERGVPYNLVESLLDGIQARSKLLLVDTCHSGELDEIPARAPAATVPAESTPAAADVRTGAAAGADQLASNIRQVRSFRGMDLSGEPRPTAQANTMRALLGELFADLRRGSGATVIAAAGGAEYAQESPEWHNGVFTYTVLAGLRAQKTRQQATQKQATRQQRDRKADVDGDGRVRVSELRDYVTAEVPRLTGGRQTPTARRENLEGDFVLD